MSPKLKKWIIIGNILVYVVVCLGIYTKKKGGFKKAFLQKKVTIEEIITPVEKETTTSTTIETSPAQ